MTLFMGHETPLFVCYSINNKDGNDDLIALGQMMVCISPKISDNMSNTYHENTKDLYKDKKAIMK
jgi:hypothetical protein